MGIEREREKIIIYAFTLRDFIFFHQTKNENFFQKKRLENLIKVTVFNNTMMMMIVSRSLNFSSHFLPFLSFLLIFTCMKMMIFKMGERE
jgi:hypothetical protein